MRLFVLRLTASVFLAATALYAQDVPPPPPENPSPWNGSWKLDVHRSSPVAAEPGVPQVYRLTLGDAQPGKSARTLRWEIPELGEVVTGHTDGNPMPVHRNEPTPGLTLLVRAEGPAVMHYRVLKNGVDTGGGTMMLVDDGHAWVDLTWPTLDGHERQDLASELVYVRQ